MVGPLCIHGSGALTASVDMRAPALPIDHVALSRGLPDGLYVAGKRLRPWLTFAERLRLVDLQMDTGFRRLSTEEQAEREALTEASKGESIVVRWTIEGGHPGAATIEMSDEWLGPREVRRSAYTWAPADETGRRHVHVNQLRHALVDWALIHMGRQSDGGGPYYALVDSRCDAFGDEWVLPIADVCRLIAAHDVRLAREALDSAVAVAAEWGAPPAERS